MSDGQVYRCPECGREVTVAPKDDDVMVLLGCADGHDTKDMAEKERLMETHV